MPTITPEQWERDLRQASTRLIPTAEEVARRAGARGEQEARALASTRLRVRSGRLVGSIRASVERRSGIEVVLEAGGVGVPYARIHEEGGRTWNRGQIHGQHYLRDGRDRGVERVEGELVVAVDRLVQGGR